MVGSMQAWDVRKFGGFRHSSQAFRFIFVTVLQALSWRVTYGDGLLLKGARNMSKGLERPCVFATFCLIRQPFRVKCPSRTALPWDWSPELLPNQVSLHTTDCLGSAPRCESML